MDIDADTETVASTALVPLADTSLAVSLARAEVDQQVATARALPRSIHKAVGAILTLATLDADSAAECIYALPRGGKPIKGASIRLAEIIASQWGNCRVGARVVHVDRTEKYVEAEGVFHDLEHNTATTARVRRRISDKSGRILSDDMIIVTGNAACSIAKRNAILGAVPKGVWRKAYDAVEKVIAGDVQTLAVRRTTAMKAFAAFGVKPEQVAHALGVAGLDDIGLDHMPILIGMHSALKNGEETVESMFGHGRGGKTFDVIANPLADLPLHDPKTGEIKESAALPSAADKGGNGDGNMPPATTPLPPEQSAADMAAEAQEGAFLLGREDRGKGRKRMSMPSAFVSDKAMMKAWLAGWDSADAGEGS